MISRTGKMAVKYGADESRNSVDELIDAFQLISLLDDGNEIVPLAPYSARIGNQIFKSQISRIKLLLFANNQ
jgi:hypothetical protein